MDDAGDIDVEWTKERIRTTKTELNTKNSTTE